MATDTHPPIKPASSPIAWEPRTNTGGYHHFVGDQGDYAATIQQHGRPFYIRQRGPEVWRASWKLGAR
jgi:hypothetical protein